jgi:tRNA (guanine37-N1)-methyltransferase
MYCQRERSWRYGGLTTIGQCGAAVVAALATFYVRPCVPLTPRPIAAEDRAMFSATLLTLFPEMFPGPLGLSLAGDALQRGLWSLETFNIRGHGLGRHRAVDDTPAGGGPGMVIRADVLAASLDAEVKAEDPRPRLIMSPRGEPLTQARVKQWAAGPGLIIVCPRFEGVDERVIEARNLTEVSIGDYILSGGEIAALAVLDACVRLLPGVMGKTESGAEESFESGQLEYPHYTRPREWEGRAIPDVLLNGDHARIAKWRREEAEKLTRARRPDLLKD